MTAGARPRASRSRPPLWLALAFAVAIAVAALGRSATGHRVRSRIHRWAHRHRGRFYGRLQGAAYRLGGGRPNPDVPDTVLADRVRSVLGPLEHRLDVPHVHVMANRHLVTLHGEVPTAPDADAIVAAVRRVSGVAGVDSELRIGLTAGDTRPSEGRLNRQASPMYSALTQAAEAAVGRPDPPAEVVAGAVVGTWLERLPKRERSHLIAHFPPDVREFLPPAHRRRPTNVRSPSELYTTVAARCDLHDYYTAREATKAVLATLRDLVPEENRDVEGVLPEPLAALWTSAERLASGQPAS